MKLVIVESPTKANTIAKFLGADYRVESSYGHIRDLPKSKLSIDVAHDFRPTYAIPAKAKEVVALLTKEAKRAKEVILATDEDREGEAISWHLAQALGLADDEELRAGTANSRIKRIAFHEITKSAIEEALKNPRGIDLNLVDAQQARRVLDRLVGYELSPFLWRKVCYGLSAGRVQSVAVRLVVEREREIEKFDKEEYWSIEALFAKPRDKRTFAAHLHAKDGTPVGKMGIKTADEANAIIKELNGVSYAVASVSTREVVRTPAPPFTTSTLQQEAARKLGFSAKQTMLHAQRLYERGFITYMRTDSMNLAKSALAQAHEVIGKEFGEKYRLPEPRYYRTTAKGAQEAHEAIRPTDLARGAHELSSSIERGGKALYDLIWKRTVACQMQPALLEQTAVDISAAPRSTLQASSFTFRATGQTVKFDGFIRVYTEGKDENGDEEIEGMLPDLAKGQALDLMKLDPLEHFTEPPPRYTDATLIKTLEAAGIGRPSTYAPTLSTIQERGYVEKVEKKYRPTEIGTIVNDILVEHFPEIVDIGFTSHVEAELDDIAEGKINWVTVCREFYDPFKKHLVLKEAEVEKHTEVSTVPCPHCGKPMLIKFGRMGKFMACPEEGSKVTLPMPEEAAKIKELEEKTKDERCPICGKPMEVKRGRFGFFLGCTDYPVCKGISKIWDKTGFKCPNCLARRSSESGGGLIGDIVLKKSRGRGKPFYACTRYPECTFLMNKKPESETDLAEALEAWRKKESEPKKPAKRAAKKRV
jgi:DNA topoisomerase I